MADLKGTRVASVLVPTSDLDTFPTHTEEYSRGSFRTVATIAERNSITLDRRKEGMLVFVLSDNALYQLRGGVLNSNWGLFEFESKRLIPFLNTDEITISDVTDYGLIEVWYEDPLYKPSLFNGFTFNQPLFNQTYQYATKSVNDYTAYYIQDDSTLIINLPALKSGIVVLR